MPAQSFGAWLAVRRRGHEAATDLHAARDAPVRDSKS